MRYRMLGRSELMVSEVGFGGWAIGGRDWGEVDDETSIAAVRQALDSGVNFFDTADVYGDGHGEEVLGEALEGNRELAVIATKAGLRSPSGSDFSPEHIVAALEGSLKRLRTEYIDLLQLHNPTKTALVNDELWETLQGLKDEGKIRGIGASVRTPAEALLAIERGADTVQVPFNVIDQDARELLGRALDERVGVIARVPLASGLLTGKYGETHRFSADDHRRRYSPERRREMLRRARSLDPVVEELGSSRAQAAIAFVLSYSGVSVTIPGMKNAEQATENALSSALAPLPPGLVRHLEQAHDNGFPED